MGKNLSPIYEVVLFTPPKLKKNKIGCYIEYYALSPFSGKLERQRIKLNSIANRFSSKSDFRLYALSLCSELNSKLVGGWSPFGISATENSYSLTPVKELLEKFIEDKKLSVRKDTLRSYSSFVNQLSQFIDKNVPNIRIKDFNKRIAIQVMDHYYKKGISNVSYNNFLKVARCFFSWCTEKMYIKENVFATIKPKKREQKKRTIIDKDYRNIITKYLTEKGDFYFLLVMNLIFSSLIRPKELCNLRIKHIDIDNKVINIPSEIAKTHYERFSAITPEIESLIFKLNLLSYNKELYIFGTGRTMQPATKPFNPHSLSKKFERLRTELNLPKNFQLYSFRDSGINNMLLSGIDALSVMQHADHHDLSITTRYANHQNKQLTEKIYNESPKF